MFEQAVNDEEIRTFLLFGRPSCLVESRLLWWERRASLYAPVGDAESAARVAGVLAGLSRWESTLATSSSPPTQRPRWALLLSCCVLLDSGDAKHASPRQPTEAAPLKTFSLFIPGKWSAVYGLRTVVRLVIRSFCKLLNWIQINEQKLFAYFRL